MSFPAPVAVAFALLATSLSLSAASLYRDGATARSMALGGATAADSQGALDALSRNPANLSLLDQPVFELNATAGFARGRFENRANDRASLTGNGLLGDFALAIPAGPFRFGLGVSPDIAIQGRWSYRDARGGADGITSYGVQAHESDILLLRTNLGASWQLTPTFALGASVGLLYNENRLHAPYIFQSQPVLRSVKTLLDLETDGYGWNAQFGLHWKPVETVSIGLSYTTEAKIESEGRAHGEAGVQLENLGLGAARSDFAYDAEVTNVFPQQLSAGVAWNPTAKFLIMAQLDWIGWQDAFDTLEVRLSNGNNSDLNGLVDSDKLADDIPLDWRDQFVLRAGVEYAISDSWTVRAGYSFARNPVPSRTLTPLTAAIMEHTVSMGIGYRRDRLTVDLAYQWQIPNSEHVGISALAAGEYNDSEIEVGLHWIGLTTRVAF